MTTTEKNKLIAEFIGYYQPKEVKDDLHSFEVYASKRNAKKDYPKDNIITYYGSDIEDFTFIDNPKYHSSWDWLMPVIEKILDISLNLDTMEMYYNITDSIPNIEQTHKEVVEFIKWYNQNKS